MNACNKYLVDLYSSAQNSEEIFLFLFDQLYRTLTNSWVHYTQLHHVHLEKKNHLTILKINYYDKKVFPLFKIYLNMLLVILH